MPSPVNEGILHFFGRSLVALSAWLEASLGTPPPVGWKWQVQERTRPRAGEVVRHTNSALYYTLEETHELVRGDTVETFPTGQAVFVPAGVGFYSTSLIETPAGSSLLRREKRDIFNG